MVLDGDRDDVAALAGEDIPETNPTGGAHAIILGQKDSSPTDRVHAIRDPVEKFVEEHEPDVLVIVDSDRAVLDEAVEFATSVAGMGGHDASVVGVFVSDPAHEQLVSKRVRALIEKPYRTGDRIIVDSSSLEELTLRALLQEADL